MKIDHVALYCRDLEGMKRFFEKYFLATPNEMYHNPRTNLRTYILTFPDGTSRLEIMTRPEVEGDNDSQYHTGFIHISFAVGSKEAVDELTATLQGDGYETLSGPRTTGDGYYESCVKGFEGILLEITV
jgi:lactoylglutathione lyase